jgi:hypothetical protein
MLAAVFSSVAASAAEEPPRELPAWFSGMSDIPAWFFTADTLPDWFYELPAEPVWFRQIDSIPEWFYEITEIPDWFYPPDFMPELPPPDDGAPSQPGSETLPFSITLANGAVLNASVPNGMITNNAVTLDVPDGLILARNGEEIIWAGAPLRDNGVYELFADNNFDKPVFGFTIAANAVNFIDTYTAPDGFIIQSVSYDGETLVINNKSYSFLEDGLFFITLEQDFEWLSPEERRKLYASVQIDRTPPVLTFDGVGEDGRAEGRVTFTVDKEAQIRVVRNSRPFANNIAVLTEPGHYMIIAVDAAGNEVVYELRIVFRMDGAGVWVIILFSSMAAGLTLYLIRCRRKFRVR